MSTVNTSGIITDLSTTSPFWVGWCPDLWHLSDDLRLELNIKQQDGFPPILSERPESFERASVDGSGGEKTEQTRCTLKQTRPTAEGSQDAWRRHQVKRLSSTNIQSSSDNTRTVKNRMTRFSSVITNRLWLTYKYDSQICLSSREDDERWETKLNISLSVVTLNYIQG